MSGMGAAVQKEFTVLSSKFMVTSLPPILVLKLRSVNDEL
jgi:hypothetical protein